MGFLGYIDSNDQVVCGNAFDTLVRGIFPGLESTNDDGDLFL